MNDEETINSPTAALIVFTATLLRIIGLTLSGFDVLYPANLYAKTFFLFIGDFYTSSGKCTV
jgi:hypothetical protein